ncbi:DUF421 domain-containing protein [Paracidovorax sp. MALMAid1276]|uniref:DUF421 domain-containing protein n=1 Tax=Paracidovorax sp. MALMAid1276 TaxID=3411631 RepID=UPI003B9CF1E0
MWLPQIAWWELAVRAAVVYAFLLLLIRLSGRRTVGQFTPFDLLVVMLLSESVSNTLSGGDDSLAAGLISATVLVSLNALTATLTAHSTKVHTLLEGDPVLVGRDGQILHKALKAQRVPVSDLRQALRAADCELQSMQYAFLEVDGTITILKKPDVPVQRLPPG